MSFCFAMTTRATDMSRPVGAVVDLGTLLERLISSICFESWSIVVIVAN